MDQPARNATPGPRAVLAAALVAAAFLVGGSAALSVSPAWAGTWTQMVCYANGNPAPIEGMTPVSVGTAAVASDRCSDESGGLVALVSSATSVPAGTASSWTYTAPGGSVIAGGTISLQLYAPNGVAYVSTPTAASSDILASCSTGGTCGSSGALTEAIPISHPGGTHIYAIAECTGSCPAGGGGAGLDAQVNVFAMFVQLTNNAVPTGTSFAGGLLTPGAAGTQPLTFTAADPGGPGIDVVTVTVDGKTVYSADPDNNGGECAPVGKDASGVNEWLYAQPCVASVNASIPVDTTQFADGAHHLVVSVGDAAGNTATVLDRSITITNHPASTPPPSTPPSTTPPPPSTPAPNPCSKGKPKLSLRVLPLGNGRIRFTGALSVPHGCSLGSAKQRPVALIEVKSGRLWQAVGVTARVTPSGSYKVTYEGGRRGSIGGRFSFRAVTLATPQIARTTSPTRRARVR